MIRREEFLTMKAIALCHKPYLKPEEALIYCNLGRTQFAKKCEEYHIQKKPSGWYDREELNRMMSGEPSPLIEAAKNMKIKKG